MEIITQVSHFRAKLGSAISWVLSSNIRPIGGFVSSQRVLLSGIYYTATNRRSIAFLVTTEEEALASLARERPGVLLATPGLEAGCGISLVKRARSVVDDIRTILLCDQHSDDLLAAGHSHADAVICQHECLADESPLQAMAIALSLGRRFHSAAVQDALKESQPTVGGAGLHALPPLSPRERALIDLWVKGFGDREAAETLGLTYATVRSYGRALRRKLNVVSRAQAVAKVMGVRQEVAG